MFTNGRGHMQGQSARVSSAKPRRKGWRYAAALAAAAWSSSALPAFADPLLEGPTLGGQVAATLESTPQPQMFPATLVPLSGSAVDTSLVRPVQHSLRDAQAATHQNIEAMPNDFRSLEVIHNRSQLVYTRKNVRRFAITDPGVIEVVQYTPTEFAIIGNARATTDLMIWFEGEDQPLMYLVTVIPDPSLEEQRRIDYGKIERKLALLYPNSQVYLIPLSRKVVVRGQAKDSQEAARIMQIVRGEVYTQDGSLFGGYTGGDAGYGGAGGGGTGDDAYGNNGNFADPLSSIIVDELQVPGEFTVKIRVRIAELNRAQLREFGVNWNSLVEISGDQLQFGSNVGSGNVLNFTGVFDNFTINTLIDALASNGTVKIMEDAALVTLAGQSAAFLSGGEFAVPTTVGLNGVGVGTTTFRGFGTSIIATPSIIDNDLIRMQIVPELSQQNGTSVGGVPGLNVKRIQTQVELREGQTIVLGGLFERQTNVEQTRVPLLGELPIVGPTLFSSKRATEDEKELLIVVTPEIVRPLDADQTPPLPGWYVTHPDDFDFYKLNRTEGNPDLGHYQLLPYGNGQGYAQDVGYNYYNPAPTGGGLGPAANGGTAGGMAGVMQAYPAPVYSGGYVPPQGAPATVPMMPQSQPGMMPGPTMDYEPQPTPVMQYPTTYYGQRPQAAGQPQYGVQQTSGVMPLSRPVYGSRPGVRR
jgi:pilus assembly protein CpaC